MPLVNRLVFAMPLVRTLLIKDTSIQKCRHSNGPFCGSMGREVLRFRLYMYSLKGYFSFWGQYENYPQIFKQILR